MVAKLLATLLVLPLLRASDVFLPSPPCFTPAEIKKLGIFPPIRGPKGKVKIIAGAWDSIRLVAEMAAIMFQDAMGLNVTIGITSGGGVEGFEIMDAHSRTDEIAFYPELWDNIYPDQLQEFVLRKSTVRNLGPHGYDGNDALMFFIPNQTIVNQFDVLAQNEIQAYVIKNTPYLASLGEVPDTEDWIAQDTEVKKKMLAALPKGFDEVKALKPTRVFDPWKCRQKNTCFEWILVNPKQTVNVFQSIVRNLELPVYCTWWHVDDDQATMALFKVIIIERAKARLPTFYNMWEPDALTAKVNALGVENKIMFFKPDNRECLSDTTTTNLEGFSSRDCYSAQTKLSKMVSNNKELPDPLADVILSIMDINLRMSDINEMLNLYEPPLTYYDAACTWMKNRTSVWNSADYPWWTNTYQPPVEGLPVNLILLIMFGTCVVLLFFIWLLTYYGVCLVAAEQFLTDTTGCVVSVMLESIEVLSSIWLTIELQSTENNAAIPSIFIAFSSIGVIVCVTLWYYNGKYLWFKYNDTSHAISLLEHPHAERSYFNLEYTVQLLELNYDIAWTNVLILFAENIPGIALTVYMLVNSEDTKRFSFIAFCLLIMMDTGNSFRELAVLNNTYHLWLEYNEEKLEHKENQET